MGGATAPASHFELFDSLCLATSQSRQDDIVNLEVVSGKSWQRDGELSRSDSKTIMAASSQEAKVGMFEIIGGRSGASAVFTAM